MAIIKKPKNYRKKKVDSDEEVDTVTTETSQDIEEVR